MTARLFRSVRCESAFDYRLWLAVAGTAGFALLLAFAAFQRLNLL